MARTSAYDTTAALYREEPRAHRELRIVMWRALVATVAGRSEPLRTLHELDWPRLSRYVHVPTCAAYMAVSEATMRRWLRSEYHLGAVPVSDVEYRVSGGQKKLHLGFDLLASDRAKLRPGHTIPMFRYLGEQSD